MILYQFQYHVSLTNIKVKVVFPSKISIIYGILIQAPGVTHIPQELEMTKDGILTP